MAEGKLNRRLFSLHVMLVLVLISVEGNEEPEDTFKSGRTLALEHFLPMNGAQSVEVMMMPGRERRGLEGSGEGDEVFSEMNSKLVESEGLLASNATLDEKYLESEGSGEIEPDSECLDGGKECSSAVPIIGELETLETDANATEESVDEPEMTSTNLPEVTVKENLLKLDDEEVSSVQPEGTTTPEPFPTTPPMVTTTENEDADTTEEIIESTTEGVDELTTILVTEGYKEMLPTTKLEESITTETSPTDTTTIGTTERENETTTEEAIIKPLFIPEQEDKEPTEPPKEATTQSLSEDTRKLVEEVIEPTTANPTEASTSLKETFRKIADTKPVPMTEVFTTETTPTPPPPPREPIVEPVFKETRLAESEVQAPMGNILQKKNMTQEVDPLLIITNTILMDSEETVQLSSSEPKRLGAYIVIGLILLSFSSLVGYITFRRRMNRKKQDFESNQESNDTEKALLGLSDYKDNSELEENHLKNNEITPIVVKSNSQINKFEKNTNFSSPKNLNTIANEKNIEKDNVLKSTAENLTQVIIEDSPKDLEEDRNVPNMEKLIVKTRVDQDSIPKKPIIVNRSSGGYVPIPQDNP